MKKTNKEEVAGEVPAWIANYPVTILYSNVPAAVNNYFNRLGSGLGSPAYCSRRPFDSCRRRRVRRMRHRIR